MQVKQWGAFILLGLIWGTSFVWIKIAVAEVGPFTLVALRLTVAFLGLLVIMRLTGQSFPRDRKTWPAFILMGALNTALPFTLISWGETRIPSSLASILNGTVPLFIIIIAHFWLHDEKITVQKLAGLGVGFVGTVILVSRDIGPEGLHGNIWGQLAVIGASASYAVAYTFARRYMRGTSPVVQSAMQMLIGGTLMWLSFPLSAAGGQVLRWTGPIFTLPTLPLTWVAIVWLGLLGSCVAFMLMFYLVNEWGPTRASVVTYIFPVVGLGLGLLLLNETPDWRLLAGAALIVGGIGVLNVRLPGRRAQASVPAEVSAMTRRYDFVQVDVFTDRPFGGNPLAVFTDGRGLSSAEMQTLAREMNYSESTFVFPAETPGALRRVEIFTPAMELPVAGHPTVGTTWVLAANGLVPFKDGQAEIVLDLGIGPVAVAVEGHDKAPSFVWMTHRPAEFGPVRTDRDKVAEALGVTAADLRDDVPMQVVSTGVPFLFVPVRSLAAIGRCSPNQAALARLYPGEEPRMVYLLTTETVSPEARVHSRMFAPHVADIPEDPATGVAAAPLGAYLARYGLLPEGALVRFIVEQGMEMGRPSRIHVEVRREGEGITGLRIGGQAVIVGEGTIYWG